MPKEVLHTAPCRFCNQMIQLDEAERTEQQAIEDATMRCRCTAAERYQKAVRRRERALENVSTLFGKESDEIQELLKKQWTSFWTIRWKRLQSISTAG